MPLITAHSGRLITTAGDLVVAEFGSAINAVKCAIAIQKAISERNSTIDPSRRMQLRIGINLGDVIVDESNVYGEGINVAARLEGIAEPGGICISDKVFNELRGKFEISTQEPRPPAVEEHRIPSARLSVRSRDDGVTPVMGTASRAVLSVPEHPSIAVLSFTKHVGQLRPRLLWGWHRRGCF